MPKFTCSKCDNHIPTSRHVLGYRTCLKCGEIEAKKVKHTIAPMHKSNYMGNYALFFIQIPDFENL